MFQQLQSNEGGKDYDSIHSNTTPDERPLQKVINMRYSTSTGADVQSIEHHLSVCANYYYLIISQSLTSLCSRAIMFEN